MNKGKAAVARQPRSRPSRSGSARRAPGSAGRRAQAGVTKILEKPDVMAAVLQVLGAQAAPAVQPSTSLEVKDETRQEVEDETRQEEENLRAPSFYRGPPPTMRDMRAAGYLGSEQELKSIWAWARDSEQESVWPTPVAGMQEAVRFDACGWPTPTSTADEWITCVSFWTALREQLVGGASRSQRRAVTSTFAGFKSG
jgi:hypothetical protein